MIPLNDFWTLILPNWIMALAAAWGVFEIVRGYFQLRKQQNENEQKTKFLEEQLNEFRKQTTQFEYQTTIMGENNSIIEKGISNLIGILSISQEAKEQQAEIERQRRIIDIRPYFVFDYGYSAPDRFSIELRNQGGTATNLRIIATSTSKLVMDPLKEDSIIERGQKIVISGRASQGQNANIISGQISLGFTDIEGNKYMQNIIKNNSGYQIGLPTKV